jgi:hypothetical protein
MFNAMELKILFSIVTMHTHIIADIQRMLSYLAKQIRANPVEQILPKET